jgi:hypothetical protein
MQIKFSKKIISRFILASVFFPLILGVILAKIFPSTTSIDFIQFIIFLSLLVTLAVVFIATTDWVSDFRKITPNQETVGGKQTLADRRHDILEESKRFFKWWFVGLTFYPLIIFFESVVLIYFNVFTKVAPPGSSNALMPILMLTMSFASICGLFIISTIYHLIELKYHFNESQPKRSLFWWGFGLLTLFVVIVFALL